MKLKLKQRVYTGFTVIALIAMIIMALAVSFFIYSSENFKQFVNDAQKLRLAMTISKDVTEIQRQALIYTSEGHSSAADQVYEIYNHTRQHLTQQANVESLFHQQIMNHLDDYIAAFKQVQKQRNRQMNLVSSEIRESATQAEQHFHEYQNSVHDSSDVEMRFLHQHILTEMLLIEKYAMRYFDSLDPDQVSQTGYALSHVQNDLEQLQQQTKLPAALHSLTETRRYITHYQQVFLEAVQRTRGYLFLVHVVMSAEAYEILYLSRQTVDHLSENMERIENHTLDLIEKFISFTVIASLVLIGLIILFSVLISRSITRPILKLTQTFNALAHGQHTTPIQPYPIQDEIGALTEAAIVFKNKNRQTEELLTQARQLTADLERSNDELEQFVYTVSHDLKSPLVTSMGFIGIIQKLAAAGKPDEAIEKLDRVIQSNRRMSQLINDLLELSRIGRVELDQQSLDLNLLLQHFNETHEQQLEQAQMTLTIRPDLPIIWGNESRLLQIFENLLSNALKYARNADGTGTQLEIGSLDMPEYHRIYFKDNGPGIAEEFHEKIFGLFYRLDNQAEGTGIGLAVAAKVMKFHGGKIWVESQPDQGAIFWLQFPKPDLTRQD